MQLHNLSLWDLDNCLFDDSWRTPLIDWDKEGNAKYDRYDARMIEDEPAHLAEWRIITAISQPIFITGRRERWRDVTTRVIKTHLHVVRNGELTPLINPIVLMRPDDSNESPVRLKERLLKELLVSRHYTGPIIGAFDDVQSIVDMYRSYDIPAAVLRCHDPKTAYASKDL